MKQNFESSLQIDQLVNFCPAYKDIVAQGIGEDLYEGQVVAVRFTKCKVWYDVLSIYHGYVFHNVPSDKAFEIKTLPPESDDVRQN